MRTSSSSSRRSKQNDKYTKYNLHFDKVFLYQNSKKNPKNGSLENLKKYINNGDVDNFALEYSAIITHSISSNSNPKSRSNENFDDDQENNQYSLDNLSLNDRLFEAIESLSKHSKLATKDIKGATIEDRVAIINLLLLNPNLNKAHLNEEGKTALKILLNTWEEAHLDNKEQISKLLKDYLARSTDLTSITSLTTYNRFLMFGSAVAACFLSYKLNTTLGFWKYLLIIPVLKVVYLSSSILVAWYGTQYIASQISDKYFNKDRLNLDPLTLTGSYGEHHLSLILAENLIHSIKVNVTPSIDQTYEQNYHQRRNLLQKYAQLRTLPVPKNKLAKAKHLIKDRQFKLLTNELKKHYEELDLSQITSSLDQGIFNDDVSKALSNSARKTFNAENFNNILNGLLEDQNSNQSSEASKRNEKGKDKAFTKEKKSQTKKTYLNREDSKETFEFDNICEVLAFHDLADKGFIKLEIETMYVLNELTNHIIYPGYKSPLFNPNASDKTKDEYLSLNSFLIAFDMLDKAKQKATDNKRFPIQEILDSINKFNNAGGNLHYIYNNKPLKNHIIDFRDNIIDRFNDTIFPYKTKGGESSDSQQSTHPSVKQDNSFIGKFIDQTANYFESKAPSVLKLFSVQSVVNTGWDAIKTQEDKVIFISKIASTVVLTPIPYFLISSSLRFPLMLTLLGGCFYPELIKGKAVIIDSCKLIKGNIDSIKKSWSEYNARRDRETGTQRNV